MHSDGLFVGKGGSYAGAPYVIRFEDGSIYWAQRNETGFYGRQWELSFGEAISKPAMVIQSDMASLAECVQRARVDHNSRLAFAEALKGNWHFNG
jgi:hypothetical protein